MEEIILLPPRFTGEGGEGAPLAQACADLPPPWPSSRSRIYPTSADQRCRNRASPISDARGGGERRGAA
jgi:hypothetical protein